MKSSLFSVRRLIQVVLLLLLLVLLCGPLFETVDHWDHFAQGGNDLVLNALGVVVGFGLSVLVSFLLRLIFRPAFASFRLSLVALPQIANAFLGSIQPAPDTSPPLPLRI